MTESVFEGFPTYFLCTIVLVRYLNRKWEIKMCNVRLPGDHLDGK